MAPTILSPHTALNLEPHTSKREIPPKDHRTLHMTWPLKLVLVISHCLACCHLSAPFIRAWCACSSGLLCSPHSFPLLPLHACRPPQHALKVMTIVHLCVWSSPVHNESCLPEELAKTVQKERSVPVRRESWWPHHRHSRCRPVARQMHLARGSGMRSHARSPG